MNCDQAFDAMTDPTGSAAGALREHLSCCPRCRQMRETLAPALEAFADVRDLSRNAARVWSPTSLPQFDLQQLAASAAETLTQPTPALRPRRRAVIASGLWNHVATASLLLVLGAGIGWGGHRLLQDSGTAPAALANPVANGSACQWKNRQAGDAAGD